ncbi:MAG: Thiamine biosynthesis protein-like protein, partial [Parcubacteria group bacterium LiPW_39]
NFCGPSKARPAAAMLGVPLREVDIREDFLAVLKKPKYGYGAGMNPCIDCHALMLKKAGEIMRSENFDLVATGEVLGERPMSQHKQALKIVEKEAGLEGYLLRPLSAKLLEPTIPEKEGLVDREKLLDISGRSRQRQMALAEKFGIKNYPTPAGGCALTQEGFARRLKELMEKKPKFSAEDVDLVRFGRHFWIDSTQIILGRNQEENQILESVTKDCDVLVVPDSFVGPIVLLRGKKIDESAIEKAKELIIKFSPKIKHSKSDNLAFKIISGNKN